MWTHFIHPSLHRPHSSPQTASRSNQPFCHSAPSIHADRHTDRPTDGLGDRPRIPAYAPYILTISMQLTVLYQTQNTHEDHKAKALTFCIQILKGSPVGCASFLDELHQYLMRIACGDFDVPDKHFFLFVIGSVFFSNKTIQNILNLSTINKIRSSIAQCFYRRQ